MKKFIIGSPIRQKKEVLKEFLKSLEELDLKKYDVYYYFIDDNDEKESSDLLKSFSKKNPNVIIKDSKEYLFRDNTEYVCNSNDFHGWKKVLIQRVSMYKDDIIKYSNDNNFDYLFLIDSDIVLNPNTINHLIKRNVDIISEIFWTSWIKDTEATPQVWLQDESSSYIRDWDKNYSKKDIIQLKNDFNSKLKIPGIYEVGGLGACTLISKKAIKMGIKFETIPNVSFWGEDRHFCIRANVLGLKLYVDTVYPAYHIYRPEYLNGVNEFKKKGYNPYNYNFTNNNSKKYFNKIKISKDKIKKLYHELICIIRKIQYKFFCNKRLTNNNKITVSMVVHNEEKRYLKECLEHLKLYVDNFVIIDDASTDNTVSLIKEVLKNCDLKLIQNKTSMFKNEVNLRKLQWKETISTNPGWILFLDADEIFEDKIINDIKYLIQDKNIDAYCFRLYDFWKDGYYRDDKYWCAHNSYRPFLIRYQPKFNYKFINAKQHCGRMPKNVLNLKYINSDIRLKHFGWLNDEDKKNKYQRYKKLDPEAKYGILEQYESILDKNPNLVKFEE